MVKILASDKYITSDLEGSFLSLAIAQNKLKSIKMMLETGKFDLFETSERDLTPFLQLVLKLQEFKTVDDIKEDYLKEYYDIWQ